MLTHDTRRTPHEDGRTKTDEILMCHLSDSGDLKSTRVFLSAIILLLSFLFEKTIRAVKSNLSEPFWLNNSKYADYGSIFWGLFYWVFSLKNNMKNVENITKLMLSLHTYKNDKVSLVHRQSPTLVEVFEKKMSSSDTHSISETELKYLN